MDTARQPASPGDTLVENDDHEVVGIICIITNPCFLYFLRVSALRDGAYHPDVGTHACRIPPREVGIPTC